MSSWPTHSEPLERSGTSAEQPKILLTLFTSILYRGGRVIRVRGTGLDVVWQPLLSVWLEDEPKVKALGVQAQDANPRRSCGAPAADPQACIHLESGLLQVGLLPSLAENRAIHRECLVRGLPRPLTDLYPCTPHQCSTLCSVNSSSLLLCHSPAVPDGALPKRVFFALDNMQVDFASASGGQGFLYQPNPRLAPLSHEGITHPYHLKPGHVLDVEVSVPPARYCLGTHHPEEGEMGSEGGVPQAQAPVMCPRARASIWGSARRRCRCILEMESAW